MNSAVQPQRLAPNLNGVPETMLLTVWNRAAFAQGTDTLLADPLLLELVRRIHYDFQGRFGKPSPTHAIRSRYADERLRSFLAEHPGATVVALGEGLETQFWRVDDGLVNWYSVDLPEAIDTRRNLLPAHPRNTLLACSALDTAWIDQVAAQRKGSVFVTAAGLFMYFQREGVQTLLRILVRRLGEGELFFDCIPPWCSRKIPKSLAMTASYQTPPMPFGIALGELYRFIAQIPGLELIDLRRALATLHARAGLIHCRS